MTNAKSPGITVSNSCGNGQTSVLLQTHTELFEQVESGWGFITTGFLQVPGEAAVTFTPAEIAVAMPGAEKTKFISLQVKTSNGEPKVFSSEEAFAAQQTGHVIYFEQEVRAGETNPATAKGVRRTPSYS